MPTKARVRVFVSSTWEDLPSERKAVEDQLQRMEDAEFCGMEHFGGHPQGAREVSLAKVNSADIYVGIIGQRYGSGITEEEYRRARSNQIPCFMYLSAEEPRDQAQTEDGRKLIAFRRLAEGPHHLVL